jgi:molecular chaperone HscB
VPARRLSASAQDERDYSEQQSSLVNTALSTLVDPLSRAVYLLRVNGVDVNDGAESTTEMDPVFLMDMLELHETLMDTNDAAQIRCIGEAARAKFDSCARRLTELFERRDLDSAKVVVAEMRYHKRIFKNAQKRLGF